MLKAVVAAVLAASFFVPVSAQQPKPKRHYSASRLFLELHAHEGEGRFSYSTVSHGAKHVKEFNTLVLLANSMGYSVAASEDLEEMGLYGATFPKLHLILLNAELYVDGGVEVLIHEIGHVIHPELNAPDDDVVSQGISYVVSNEIGIDATDDTLYYLSWLEHGFEGAARDTLKDSKIIDKDAEFILTALGR